MTATDLPVTHPAPDDLPDLAAFGQGLRPYAGWARTTPHLMAPDPLGRKVRRSLEEAIEASGLRDGMTISFHHHFREGDKIDEEALKALIRAAVALNTAARAAARPVRTKKGPKNA